MLQVYKKPETLALLRITVFGCWLFIALLFSPSSYALLPVDIFHPWGFHRFISYLPNEFIQFFLSATSLNVLKIATIIGCCLLIAGIRPFKPVALFTVVCIFFLDFVIRGYNGYINHGQIVIYFAALFFVFSPASDVWSLFGKKVKKIQSSKDYSFAVLLTAITISFAYAFIGIRRFFHGGIEIFTNDALLIYTMRNSLNYSIYAYEYGLTLIEYDLSILLLKAGFFIVTLMEVVTPFILFYKYLRYSWLMVMIPFHFMTLFTMNIFFWENILLILVLFVKWEHATTGFFNLRDKIKLKPTKFSKVNLRKHFSLK